jgi:hypothetical protein
VKGVCFCLLARGAVLLEKLLFLSLVSVCGESSIIYRCRSHIWALAAKHRPLGKFDSRPRNHFAPQKNTETPTHTAAKATLLRCAFPAPKKQKVVGAAQNGNYPTGKKLSLRARGLFLWESASIYTTKSEIQSLRLPSQS